MTDMTQVKAAIRPDTKVVYFETIANPSMKVTDIAAVADYAHAQNPDCIVIVDNTCATPLLVQPLKLGVDIVVHSATKYLNGHGDVVAGFSVARKEIMDKIRMVGLKDITGAVLGPQEAFLILRGPRHSRCVWTPSAPTRRRWSTSLSAPSMCRRCSIPAWRTIPITPWPPAR